MDCQASKPTWVMKSFIRIGSNISNKFMVTNPKVSLSVDVSSIKTINETMSCQYYYLTFFMSFWWYLD